MGIFLQIIFKAFINEAKENIASNFIKSHIDMSILSQKNNEKEIIQSW
jgi:hypothetical protein